MAFDFRMFKVKQWIREQIIHDHLTSIKCIKQLEKRH